MPEFRKKPVVIEAMHYDGTHERAKNDYLAPSASVPMVRLVAAQCVRCGLINPTTQATPDGTAPFGTPVPTRWLEEWVRAHGSAHNGGCGPVQFEMEALT